MGTSFANIEEKFAWKTDWNQSYVQDRYLNARKARVELEGNIGKLVGSLREKGVLTPATSVQDLPVVSFMLQYFKRPRVVSLFVNMLQVCNKLVQSEFLVNVDSPQEGQAWADLSWNTSGFVVPVMSYNVHELRGYNRLAGMARGKILVFLQDDDLVEPSDCSWLPRLVAQFEAMPQLAMVGMNKLQLSHGEGNDLSAHNFLDPSTGECGIWSDWELSIRFWTAGWHVAYMPIIQKAPGDPGTPGGTHKPETGVRCWGRQQGLSSSVYMGRWGAGWGSGPGKFLEKLENHVRLTNLRLLKRTNPDGPCPFRKGCEPEGDPPLPERYTDYRREDKPMVYA
ncbi:hypothetical protein GPECTOR_8g253 [Gonium pectorale]|uniref:Glycosyltransferase 2-like domain-containing protein n=1 Tax=Gonium pectorale TaxID=33097 RepID=A0A150GT23_GONPE|nr:hypothetical protein GPECTOR_8g253 [Gonium pectorale]|eukprot:KXZ52872.1 hypothetical protein GPECTOR_8g253 [Gonium pectorale]